MVFVKVPAFWPDLAKAWFIQTQTQFALKEVIASSTKFYYCVSSFNLFALDDFQRYDAISNLP